MQRRAVQASLQPRSGHGAFQVPADLRQLSTIEMATKDIFVRV